MSYYRSRYRFQQDCAQAARENAARQAAQFEAITAKCQPASSAGVFQGLLTPAEIVGLLDTGRVEVRFDEDSAFIAREDWLRDVTTPRWFYFSVRG